MPDFGRRGGRWRCVLTGGMWARLRLGPDAVCAVHFLADRGLLCGCHPWKVWRALRIDDAGVRRMVAHEGDEVAGGLVK